jgi:hypothetical protein
LRASENRVLRKIFGPKKYEVIVDWRKLHTVELHGLYSYPNGARGGVVVEAPRYKPAGRGFDSRWCHWTFSVTSFRSHYGPGVDSASSRNEYQVYFLGVKAAGA